MTFQLGSIYSYQGKEVYYKGENIFKTFQYVDSAEYFHLEPEQEALVTEAPAPVASKPVRSKTVQTEQPAN